MVIFTARLLWILPGLLVAITIGLIRAGLNQKATFESGQRTTARVADVEIRNRADITYGHIDLKVGVPGDDSLDVRLPLPLSLLMGIANESFVDVRMIQDADQPIVIERIARAQWRMSLIHASMTGLGALLLAWGVWSWNRFLERRGDPAVIP